MRDRRKALGLTQENVAKKLKTSNSQIIKFESGVRPPRADDLAQIAKMLKTSSSYLNGETNDPLPITPDVQRVIKLYRKQKEKLGRPLTDDEIIDVIIPNDPNDLDLLRTGE